MAKQPNTADRQESDEIDLGQVFQLIGKVFQNLFYKLVGIFLYLKRNIIILLILAIGGTALGYGLSKIITKKQKIQVIVRPNWESKNYLYDVIEEVEANLNAQDSLFFKNLGVEITNFGGYEVMVEPINNPSEKEEKEQMAYLQVLQKFENTGIVSDILRTELLNTSALNHRITFIYKDYTKGPQFARAVINHVNSNAFYKELAQIHQSNATSRIEENKVVIGQVDQILSAYSNKISQSETPAEGRIVLSTEDELNVADLLELKNMLIRDNERMKLQLLEQRDAINIINYGKPQQVQKSFFGKKIVLVPTILILLFFLVDFVKYLNRKALEYYGSK